MGGKACCRHRQEERNRSRFGHVAPRSLSNSSPGTTIGSVSKSSPGHLVTHTRARVRARENVPGRSRVHKPPASDYCPGGAAQDSWSGTAIWHHCSSPTSGVLVSPRDRIVAEKGRGGNAAARVLGGRKGPAARASTTKRHSTGGRNHLFQGQHIQRSKHARSAKIGWLLRPHDGHGSLSH